MLIRCLSQTEEFSKLFTDCIYLEAGDLIDDRAYIQWRSQRTLELFDSLDPTISTEIMHFIHSLAIGQHLEPQQSDTQTIADVQAIAEIKMAINTAYLKNPEAAQVVINDFVGKLNAVALGKPVLKK